MASMHITSIDFEKCKHIARNSKRLLAMERKAADGIYKNIYATAPHTTPHEYAYRDNFRIEHRLFPYREGYVTYLIAERFQWRWIEYGYTQWQTKKKYRGKHIMRRALETYGQKGYE